MAGRLVRLLDRTLADVVRAERRAEGAARSATAMSALDDAKAASRVNPDWPHQQKSNWLQGAQSP
ncbi:MAG: hypothetical protein ABIU87_12345 [Ornithinibacter sp.]